MTTQSSQLELAERPVGNIVPGKTFRLRTVPAPKPADLKDGQVLVETLYLSLVSRSRGTGKCCLPKMRYADHMARTRLCAAG